MRRMQENPSRPDRRQSQAKAAAGIVWRFWPHCVLMFFSWNVFALEPGSSSPDKPATGALMSYAAKSGAYRVGIPEGWEATWSPAPNGTDASELQLAAPDQAWPNHVVISILHYASVHRTLQRYLFDIENPTIGGREDVRNPVSEARVAGLEAKSLDVATYRYPLLGTDGEKVAALRRHVVVPAGTGFFVFRFDAPKQLAAAYRVTFERVVASFVPQVPAATSAPDPIPDDEYEVLTAFFKSPPPKGSDVPEYFDATVAGRYLVGRTLAPRQARTATWPSTALGELGAELIEDYWEKNRKEWLLTDRILVPHLRVVSSEEVNAQLSAGLKGSGGSDRRLHGGGIVYVSRIGFNRAKDAALFGVAVNYPRAMGARYLVLMQKQDGAWRLVRAAMESLIIQ